MAILNQKPNISFLQNSLFSLVLLFSIPSQADELRIVSLSPAITEVLFDLGLQKNIVGTSSFSNYPEEAKKIPSVGSYLSPSIEKIIRLNPTHVLAFKEGDPSIGESLDKAKLNTIVLESRSLDDFENMLKELGALFKVEKKSQEIISLWKTQWSKLENVPRSKEKLMIQVDQSPIYIAGNDTFISRAFEKCGFRNTFDNLDGYKKIQLEAVMNRKPEIILVVGMIDQSGNFNTVKEFWKSNPVTKNARIIQGDGDILSRLSPRFPKEVIKICSQLKPLKAAE
ncbi:MAG: helical backbone metal receptor [Bdellovibrionota bacterium]